MLAFENSGALGAFILEKHENQFSKSGIAREALSNGTKNPLEQRIIVPFETANKETLMSDALMQRFFAPLMPCIQAAWVCLPAPMLPGIIAPSMPFGGPS